MTDKSHLVSKMNQPTGNGHHGANNSNPQGQQKLNKNDSRGNRGSRGKDAFGTRNREKLSNQSEGDGHEISRSAKNRQNTKRGKLVNDMVDFECYRPHPEEYNRITKTRKHVANYVKEDYVHVSCQFVVKESNCNALAVIDSCVDWSDVIQIRLPCEELSTCPICLYPPVCPMSPVCGHAMCYACVLRFQDNCPGGDCPICHHPLIMPDFRPLKTFPRQKYNIGDEMVMKLVSRNRDGKVVCPVDEDSSVDNIPNLNSEWGSQFCNVVTATCTQILHKVILPQEEELKTQLALLEDSDKESEPYILQALDKLADRKDECFAEMESLIKNKSKQSNEDEAGCSSNKQVFFYQSADGQPIFMHPLNSRCLIHENGSIEECLPEISCKIIAMEYYTQSPELRSRGDLERRSNTRQVKEQKENAYTKRLSRKLAEKEVTYRSSASLPTYTEITKPTKDHFKTPESYDMLTFSPSSPPDDGPISFAEKLSASSKTSSPWTKTAPTLVDRARINSTSSDMSVGSDAGAPSYQHSFRASINDAFATLEVSASPVASGGRGKKKKNKGKTISLTGGLDDVKTSCTHEVQCNGILHATINF